MALIDCPECSHRISDQSNSCPNCGFVTNNKKVLVRTHQARKSRKPEPKHYRIRDLGKPLLFLIIGIFILKLPSCFYDESNIVQPTQPTSPDLGLTQIPMLLSGSGEDGRYFLISQTRINDIENIEYVRKGKENDAYGKMEINCSGNKIRKTSSDSPESLGLIDIGDWYTPTPDWTDKDIFNFICK